MNTKFIWAMASILAGFNIGHAQTNTFPTTGNAGIGTLTPTSPLQVIGSSRFGGTSNYGQFDANGILTFNGNGVYRVGSNKYAFQYANIPNYGLFFNSSDIRYEFRNGNATPIFYVGADSGQAVFNGGVSIGTSTLPPINGLYVSGNMGIGTNTPDVKLHVTGGTNVTLGSGGTIVVGLTTAPNLAIDNNEIQARDNGDARALEINGDGGNVNVSDGGLFVQSSNDFVGIGTTAPAVRLNVVGGTNLTLGGGGYIVAGSTTSNNLAISDNEIQARSDGVGSYLGINEDGGDVNISRGALVVESDNNFVGIGAAPSARLHVYLGEEATLGGGGYIVTGAPTYLNLAMDNNEIQARNNGAASSLYLNPEGGTTLVGGDLEVNGTEIRFGSTEEFSDEGVYTIGTNSDFVPSVNASLGNSTDRWDEVWAWDGTINSSDEKYKSNIKDLNYGLKEIMQLRSVRFNWKGRIEKGEKLGLIAQELQKVMPEVVRDFEFKTNEQTGMREKVSAAGLGVMYADIIPVLVKGIQEQQQMIEQQNKKQEEQQQMIAAQNKKMETLTQLISQLTGSQSVTSASKESAVKSTAIISGASLEQNAPNPFNQNTVIIYYLPQHTGNAFIKITDMNGRVIKTVAATAKGKGQLMLQAAELAAGTYQYALIIDGKLIDTKKMVLMK